jgi:hypothetical protein
MKLLILCMCIFALCVTCVRVVHVATCKQQCQIWRVVFRVSVGQKMVYCNQQSDLHDYRHPYNSNSLFPTTLRIEHCVLHVVTWSTCQPWCY